MALFVIYNYQFSPIMNKGDDELFPDFYDVDVNESIQHKHEIFEEFFDMEDLNRLQIDHEDFNVKMVSKRDHFIVFRIANNKKIRLERDFEDFDTESHPSCYVLLDNRDNTQVIAVQKCRYAFYSTKTVVKILMQALNGFLAKKRLRVNIGQKFSTHEFWNFVEQHDEGIKKVEFYFGYPNMPVVTDLVENILELGRRTNSDPSVMLKGQNKEPLILSKEETFLINSLRACAATGRPIYITPMNKQNKVKIGTKEPIILELNDQVLEGLKKEDLFDSHHSRLVEFMNHIKLYYDE